MAGSQLKLFVPSLSTVHVAADGEYIHCKSENAFDSPLRLEVDGKSIDFETGDKLRLDKPMTSGFLLHNDTLADINAVIVVGRGDFDQGQLVGSVDVSSITGPVDISKPTVFDFGVLSVDFALASLGNIIFVGTPQTRYRLVQNLHATSVLKMTGGFVVPQATAGLELQPKQIYRIDGTDTISIYNPSAGVVNLAIFFATD